MWGVGGDNVNEDVQMFTSPRENGLELGAPVAHQHLGKTKRADPPPQESPPHRLRCVVIEQRALLKARAM
eukprot:6572115-Pyramimonas_sp.AAC.1